MPVAVQSWLAITVNLDPPLATLRVIDTCDDDT